MSNTAYRSDDVILQARRHELLEKRWAARADVEALVEVQGRQSARKIGGAVGATLAAIGVGAFLLFVTGDSVRSAHLFSLGPPSADGLLTVGVFFVPVIMLVVITSGRTLRAMSLRAKLKELFSLTEDLRADVTRLETASDLVALRDRLIDRAGASYALPFAVLAVCAPLMLHFVVFAVFHAFVAPNKMDDVPSAFDPWIVMSAGLMALSYLVLVVRVFGFAERVRTVETEQLQRFGSGYGFATLGLTSLAACVPGAILFFIPPVVSFVTGLALLPAMFTGYGALIRRDRLAIEAAFSSAV